MSVDSHHESRLHSESKKSASLPDPQEPESGHSERLSEKDSRSTAASNAELAPNGKYFRDLIRLIQCKICNKPLQQPLALPCGETLCRNCLPPAHERQNISYPDQPGRRQGFACPFKLCEGQEHSLADCNLDITLTNILTQLDNVLSPNLPPDPLGLSKYFTTNLDARAEVKEPQARVSVLLSGYNLAQNGDLPFDSGFPQHTIPDGSLTSKTSDGPLLTTLLAATRSEFDCQVCYCLYNSPITTSCGHTFCESCLERIRDHSNLCPFCRRPLSSYRNIITGKSNRRLTDLLSLMYPDAISARKTQISEDMPEGEPTVPIFACAMTFPRMPMFLHIFEPRYRQMIRKAITNGTRCFGMVTHRQGEAPIADGDFDAPFNRYGTMLYITNVQMFPDGRSLIETIGTYRFKISSYSWKDGYPIAKIERVEDIPYGDEESMEATERTLNPSSGDNPENLACLSTQELHQNCLNFVSLMRNNSVGWFTDRILNIYGHPPQDPALFPFWMATLLPINEQEKYLVLVSTSVRERLKLIMVWIKAMEQKRW
ncbi:hypothetical protein H072_5729 [Dactylellina haptotyla CBS 200.50]|uniref:RING-type domain-containing protein n=1 Tax=Dactylellina haptotyla (strain CBS 200.50) TaxID=1284197 RepID=S8AH04_DACHA|nr:hypothetical protein H072_5729 [Dactylellina haptotyla CBS 200.50]